MPALLMRAAIRVVHAPVPSDVGPDSAVQVQCWIDVPFAIATLDMVGHPAIRMPFLSEIGEISH